MRRPKETGYSAQKVLPLDECLAKTVTLADGSIQKGVTVSTHCKIVGTVAAELRSRQPAWLRETLFSVGSELVSAAHDIGKVSPHFQEKIYSALGITLGFGNGQLDKTLGGHSAISQASLTGQKLQLIPEILGRHHGASPASISPANSEIYGGPAWQTLRMNLLNELKSTLHCDWPVVKDDIHATALSGLTTVADWIGSGPIFDPVLPDGRSNSQQWINQIAEAVDRAGFVGFRIRPGLSFEDVFSFNARESQSKFVQAVDGAGIYILEAPMGMGKTEAALYAAYKMLSAGNATGIYFALPTQLTSDKIYDRMNDFLGKVLADDCKFRSLLLHSSSWLRDTELGEEGMPGGGWFNSSKRGLLAPFAVGTIDQALMGVMNVKHGFVRAFGLAGKVVILDEVHSYDTYTGTIIQALVKTLSELHCTVIILSATLTSEKRAELLNKDSTENAYPLISAAPLGKPSFCLKVEKAVSSQVSLSLSPDDEVAVNEALHRAEQGEQVLWIENTVAESQQVYKLLSARAQACGKAIECGLLHSRFQRIHRSSNEEKWVGIYGKKGYSKRKECGRILVGTQVLEQSLDIDADFLVTRICPTDMLFQRIGRLWRHRKADKLRPISAKCEVLILSPRIDDCLKDVRIWGKTGRVYSPYVLYRSLDVWREITEIALPDSIRPMLQDTYVEKTEENGLINKTKSELIESREKLTGLARVTISSNGKTLPESKATTRYSKQESCEVLLIKNYLTDDTGTDVVFLNGSKIRLPKNIKTINTKEWRRLASELQKHIVLVPEYAAPVTLVNQIQWLKEYVYIGYLNESPFRAALVFLDGSLRGLDNGDALKGYSLSYTAETGYSCQKVENGAENNEW